VVHVEGDEGLGLDTLFETAEDTLAHRVIVDDDSVGYEALKKGRHAQEVGAILRGLSGQERVQVGRHRRRRDALRERGRNHIMRRFEGTNVVIFLYGRESDESGL
jgi:hypothetical protein